MDDDGGRNQDHRSSTSTDHERQDKSLFSRLWAWMWPSSANRKSVQATNSNRRSSELQGKSNDKHLDREDSQEDLERSSTIQLIQYDSPTSIGDPTVSDTSSEHASSKRDETEELRPPPLNRSSLASKPGIMQWLGLSASQHPNDESHRDPEAESFRNIVTNLARRALPDILFKLKPEEAEDNTSIKRKSQARYEKSKKKGQSRWRFTGKGVTITIEDDHELVAQTQEIIAPPSGVDVTDADLFVPHRYRPHNYATNQQNPDSTWNVAFHELVKVAAADERYDARKIKLYTGPIDKGLLYDSDTSKENESVSSAEASLPESKHSEPVLYIHRPFRSTEGLVPDDDGEHLAKSSFDAVEVTELDWSKIGEENGNSLESGWRHFEPAQAEMKLLPIIDPLVQFKLKKYWKKNRVTPQKMLETQARLEAHLTPSGRKLNGYSSESTDEAVFTRIKCKDDPEFDLAEPYLETSNGTWPHPYLNYWNWKKTDEDPNLGYYKFETREGDIELEDRLRVAAEIIDNPSKFPERHLGADDTDYDDPLGLIARQHMSQTPTRFDRWTKPKNGPKLKPKTSKQKKSKPKKSELKKTEPIQSKSSQSKSREVKTVVHDKVSQRYPYLMMPENSKIYRKSYAVKLFVLRRRQGLYKFGCKLRGSYTSSCAPCITDNPFWFTIWKCFIAKVVRVLPRSAKFLSEKKMRTEFYGTLASLCATQYIVEYDILPNMDDPVKISKEALEGALELKEIFTKSILGKQVVDYIALQRSKHYEKHLDRIGLMCRFQPIKMPPPVRKAFFINFFNVLAIQTQIVRIPETEGVQYIWEIKNFREVSKGLVGYIDFNLEEVFHGILRCNRRHPMKQSKVVRAEKQAVMPREMCPTRLRLPKIDPRIHFALSIGTKSCPDIYPLSLYGQDYELDELSKAYVRKRITVNLSKRTVTLPILFLWYERDFGNNKYAMLWYLKQFMESDQMLDTRNLLTSGKSIRFRYERNNCKIDHVVRRLPPIKYSSVHHSYHTGGRKTRNKSLFSI